MFAEWDDFRILSGHTDIPASLTLLAIVKNEMFFLPPFLEHYRQLGVKRFIVLDDNSKDGSPDFLAAQTDVVVMSSNRSFGDRVQLNPSTLRRSRTVPMHNIWRNLLIQKYATNSWTLHVDADEFLRLPAGLTLQTLLERLEASYQNAQVVWSVLLDLYPARISDLYSSQRKEYLNRSTDWYFDGLPHLRLRRNKRPRAVYHGSRARLLLQNGIISPPSTPIHKTLLRKLLRKGVGLYNLIWKPILIRRPSDGILLNSHTTNFTRSARICLPLEHYKFSSNLRFRTSQAIASNSHSNNSLEYVHIHELLQCMARIDGSFLAPFSKPIGDFQVFFDTHVAVDEIGILADR